MTDGTRRTEPRRRGAGVRAGFYSLSVLLLIPSAALSGEAAETAHNGRPAAEAKSAGKGHDVYLQYCAKCHGEQGQGLIGPPVIGSDARLGSYETAQGLLDYISTTMPQNKPGSLSDAEYRKVLAYLLASNDFLPKGQTLDEATLSDIAVK